MTKRLAEVDDLLKLTYVGDPQASATGDRILFAQKTVNEKQKYVTNLFTVSRSGALTQWTQGEEGLGGGRFSPDGNWISFVANRDKSGAQLYFIATAGGEARKMTKLPEGSIGATLWSPDSKYIVFSFRETAPEFTQKAKREREEKGGATPPIEIDDVWYRLDGDSTFGNQRYKLYLYNVDSGEASLLYSACPTGSYEFAWSPKSDELVVVHSTKEKPMIGLPNDGLYRLKLDGSATPIPGLPSGGNFASIAWSPSGEWIALIGDVSKEDPWGTRNSKAYLISANGGDFRCLSGESDYDLGVATLGDLKEPGGEGSLQWAPDGSGLYVQIGLHGTSQLGWVSLEGEVLLLTEGAHVLALGRLSEDGKTMPITLCDPGHPGEIAILDLEGTVPLQPHRLTNFNHQLSEELEFLLPQEVWVDSTDGVKVQAWVIKPRQLADNPGATLPAILEVHGGPHAQYGLTPFHEMQVLAAQGYVVVFSNPRGSKGYGEAFCAAIKADWGNKDWDDIQAVTKWMQAQPHIDSERIGIMGGSYGGYMTNWAIGHSKAYKAAITDRCVSNLVSFAGNSDFPLNQEGYFGGVAWGDLEDIRPLWKQSPIAYFKGVSTPTLVIHSEGDLRCNIEQSEQVFHALQMQGVPSRFVRYPKETSHGMSRNGPPDLRRHRLHEIINWWAKYL